MITILIESDYYDYARLNNAVVARDLDEVFLYLDSYSEAVLVLPEEYMGYSYFFEEEYGVEVFSEEFIRPNYESVRLLQDLNEAEPTPPKTGQDALVNKAINLINQRLQTPGLVLAQVLPAKEVMDKNALISQTYPDLSLVNSEKQFVQQKAKTYLADLIKHPNFNEIVQTFFEGKTQNVVNHTVNVLNPMLPPDIQIKSADFQTETTKLPTLEAIKPEETAFVFSLTANPLIGVKDALEYWIEVDKYIGAVKQLQASFTGQITPEDKSNPKTLGGFVDVISKDLNHPSSGLLKGALGVNSLADNPNAIFAIANAKILLWIPASTNGFGSADNTSFIYSTTKMPSYLGSRSIINPQSLPHLHEVLANNQVLIGGNNAEEGIKNSAFPIKLGIGMTMVNDRPLFPDTPTNFYLTSTQPLTDPGVNSSVSVEVLKAEVQKMVDDGVIHTDIKKAEEDRRHELEMKGNQGDQATTTARANRLAAETARKQKLEPLMQMTQGDTMDDLILQMAMRLVVSLKMMITGEYESLRFASEPLAFDGILANGIGQEMLNTGFGLGDARDAIEGFAQMGRLLKGNMGAKADDKLQGTGALDPAKIEKGLEEVLKAEAAQMETLKGLDLNQVFSNRNFLNIVNLLNPESANKIKLLGMEADKAFKMIMDNTKKAETETPTETSPEPEPTPETSEGPAAIEERAYLRSVGLEWLLEDTNNVFKTIQGRFLYLNQPPISLASFVKRTDFKERMEKAKKTFTAGALTPAIDSSLAILNNKLSVPSTSIIASKYTEFKALITHHYGTEELSEKEALALATALDLEKTLSNEIDKSLTYSINLVMTKIERLVVLNTVKTIIKNTSDLASELKDATSEEDQEDLLDGIQTHLEAIIKAVYKDGGKKRVEPLVSIKTSVSDESEVDEHLEELIDLIPNMLTAVDKKFEEVKTEALSTYGYLSNLFTTISKKTLTVGSLASLKDHNKKLEKDSARWGSYNPNSLSAQRLQQFASPALLRSNLGENTMNKKRFIETTNKLWRNFDLASDHHEQLLEWAYSNFSTDIDSRLVEFVVSGDSSGLAPENMLSLKLLTGVGSDDIEDLPVWLDPNDRKPRVPVLIDDLKKAKPHNMNVDGDPIGPLVSDFAVYANGDSVGMTQLLKGLGINRR